MATTTTSILDSIKKMLSISPGDESFDVDIIIHINTVFATLHQLGVGPDDSFEIEDNSATWTDFLGDVKNINSVKTYMYMKIKMIFDTPATSFAIDAFQKQIDEIEWRITNEMEGVRHPYVEPPKDDWFPPYGWIDVGDNVFYPLDDEKEP